MEAVAYTDEDLQKIGEFKDKLLERLVVLRLKLIESLDKWDGTAAQDLPIEARQRIMDIQLVRTVYEAFDKSIDVVVENGN